MKKNTVIVITLIVLCILIAFIPLFVLRGADFGGSDDAGTNMIEQVDPSYKPWATPVLELLIGGELPSETESFLFCIQTGIGVGILAYGFGYLVARKKFNGPQDKDGSEPGGQVTAKGA